MNKLEALGLNIDKLISVDINGRGVIGKLYEAAFERYGESLTLRAARGIVENVKESDVVLILTGFRILPLGIQETDGPLGAAALARAINIALGAIPIIITEPVEQSIRIVSAACRGIGLNAVELDRLLEGEYRYAVSIIGFTMDRSKALDEAKKLLDELSPSAIIAIEKAGCNVKGEYHNMRGLNISSLHAKVEPLIEEARRRGIFTVGIGDGGNEVGMGVIEDAVKKYVPYGDKCQCPCGGGIAASSKVDSLVVASVCNWGGYAISGLIGRIRNKPITLHTPRQEELMMLLTVYEGAIDGITGLVDMTADSLPLEVHKSMLIMLREMISRS